MRNGAAMISVAGLTVADPAGRRVLDDVSFDLAPGSSMGVIGRSGSGKTTLALALLGHVRPGLRVRAGAVAVDGLDVLAAKAGRLRRFRAETVAHVSQDPARALTPTMRVGALVAERLATPDDERVARVLAQSQLPSDRAFLRRQPHELSGGQQQRLALARAGAGDPKLLILDEPTTGLDVLTQELVVAELVAQQHRRRGTLVVVSHDVALVARLADEVLVLHDGVVVERGSSIAVLASPRHPYTAHLVASAPDLGRAAPQPHVSAVTGAHHPTPALAVSGLRAAHRTRRGEVVAADDIDLHVHPGECVALVGASGSGKSTIARCLVGAHRPDAGVVRLGGEVLAQTAQERPVAARRAIQLVPQDPSGSLNPRRSAGDAVARARGLVAGVDDDREAADVAELFERVGLDRALARQRPPRLSGGERQRVAIARALAADPSVLVCDEVTTALDAPVQAAILALLDRLRRELGLAVILVTHDLAVVANIADRVLVLDQGRVCEHGSVADVLADPQHRVTRQMLASGHVRRAPVTTRRTSIR